MPEETADHITEDKNNCYILIEHKKTLNRNVIASFTGRLLNNLYPQRRAY